MDRDKRWERIQLAYNALVKGSGSIARSALEAIQVNYAKDITDEFILPTVITENG
jgi:2,3-bisphosphoglycerate-independent phosphoglycerate mutase